MDSEPPIIPALANNSIPVAHPVDRLRLFELILVLSIAFAVPMFVSLYAFFFQYQLTGMTPTARSVHMIIYELTGLAALGYVLFRQGRTLFQIGLSYRLKGVRDGFGLALLAYGAFSIAYAASYYGFPESFAVIHANKDKVASALGLSVASLFLMVLNPVFEELIVRAFLITEVKALTGSTFWAVLASVTVQSLYHLYQGGLVATCYGVMFLVFSIFYARTGRIAPVIVAHCIFDVGGLLAANLK